MSTPKIPTRESHIEAYLVKRAKVAGAMCRKLEWIGVPGAPDRVVMLPPSNNQEDDDPYSGQTIWVELKAPGKKAEPHQLREHERMRRVGQRVEVIDSYEGVDALFK